MNSLLMNCILLAQNSPLEGLAREFKGRQTRLESGYLTTGLVILACLLAGLWVLSRILERRDGTRPVNSPLALFFSLCKAHELSWSQWWLLWRVARHQGLHDPARLFLEPDLLDPLKAGPIMRFRADELKSLAEDLFAEPVKIVLSDGKPDPDDLPEEDPLAAITPFMADTAWDANSRTPSTHSSDGASPGALT